VHWPYVTDQIADILESRVLQRVTYSLTFSLKISLSIGSRTGSTGASSSPEAAAAAARVVHVDAGVLGKVGRGTTGLRGVVWKIHSKSLANL
jgi:hypothetical protein